MSMKRIGEEYGEALFELCTEAGVMPEASRSLEIVMAAVSEYSQYIELLSCPNLTAEERCSLIDEAFGGRVHEYVLSFMKLMCVRGYISCIEAAILHYQKLYEAACGKITAEVISAVPLDKKQREALIKRLEARFSRSAELIFFVDKAILGGVIVNVDGNIVDGSLRGKLSSIERLLNTAREGNWKYEKQRS